MPIFHHYSLRFDGAPSQATFASSEGVKAAAGTRPYICSNLKDKMIADTSAPGATAMAVLCKDVEVLSDFNTKYKDVYKYEVLGGNHTLVAKSNTLTTQDGTSLIGTYL